MALSVEEQAMLTKFRAAWADLITGKQVAKVSSAGRNVEYTKADLPKLEQAIADLEAKSLLPAGQTVRRRGALRFSL
ncbi:gpW family head-tail joining protein [Brevundimonas sp.]|uniref:gpW family head-tail joining protein n=1 Tax=Brevundimonas sp. TaxID=1871086 RepID=UPI0028A0DF1B|nr:gpW family head-tail joining protein [Brevundimonas sp.]